MFVGVEVQFLIIVSVVEEDIIVCLVFHLKGEPLPLGIYSCRMTRSLMGFKNLQILYLVKYILLRSRGRCLLDKQPACLLSFFALTDQCKHSTRNERCRLPQQANKHFREAVFFYYFQYKQVVLSRKSFTKQSNVCCTAKKGFCFIDMRSHNFE